MKKFLYRLGWFLFIGSIPFWILLAGYLFLDPFKVLYSYDNYSYSPVISNRDYISTEILKRNRRVYHYDSFILGSSRTIAFKPSSWKHYLGETDSPFMFVASGESVYGIYTKIKYLDSLGISIDNALVILCRDVSFQYEGDHPGHISFKHPDTSGENPLKAHWTFFDAYLNPRFLSRYYTYHFTGEYSEWMKGFIDNRRIYIDPVTNEILIEDQEEEIVQRPEAYYAKREKIFYRRPGERTDSVARISDVQARMLHEIARILEKNKTNYKVVLSPLYEQIKFHPHDMKILEETFGKHLYDFTGDNRFTQPVTNYYEASHYRPTVGDSILDLIYR